MTFLLSLLARPAMLVGVIGAGALGGFALYHHFTVDRPQQKLVTKQAETIKEKDIALAAAARVEATVRLALEEQRAETLKVTGELRDVSAKVRLFEQMVIAANAKARATGLELLRAGEREAAAIRASTNRPTGYLNLNKDLCEVFASCAP